MGAPRPPLRPWIGLEQVQQSGVPNPQRSSGPPGVPRQVQTVVPRSIGVVGLVLVLAAAGGALAQSFEVTVTPPEEAVSVDAGGSATASVDVNLYGDEFYCLEETDLPVLISASGGSGVTGTPASENITFTVAGEIYNADTTGAYNETQSVDVTIDADDSAGGSSSQVTVTATFEGGDYQACGPNSFPSADDSGPIDVAVQGTTDGGGTDGGTDGGDGTDGTDGNSTDGEDGNGIPGPGLLAPVAVAGAALAARARS